MSGTVHQRPLPTGVVFPYVGTAAPAGYVLLDGGTIGNASSSGTNRANADTERLFTLLWDSMADSEAPVSSGRGASAAADFAANKTITLPDPRGRQLIGSGTGSGLTARTHGDQVGAEKHTDVPQHNHGVTDGGHSHGVTDPTHTHLNSLAYNDPSNGMASNVGSGSQGTLNQPVSGTITAAATGVTVNSATTGITIDNEGTAGGVDHVDPSIALNFICTL